MFFKGLFSGKNGVHDAVSVDMKDFPNEGKITARCGHKISSRKGEVTAFGETIETEVPTDEQNVTEYCHACLSTMAILCAWCSRPIFIGDPVTLYTPNDGDYKPPEGSRIYCEDPLQLVGCLRWGCADSGADRAGFWYPPGEVYRVPSPLEQCLQTGIAVVVKDTGDINEATRAGK